MKISIAPIPYLWPRQRVEDFYAALLGAPVDCVYVGETVCSKRRELSSGDWLALARELSRFIPEVVVSTLALIEAGSELAVLKRLAGNGEFMIEANDLATIQLAIEMKLPFVAGPTVNIYNGRTLALLAKRGMRRWVPAVELSGMEVRAILDEAVALLDGGSVETEVFAYGRLPLAHSARCFTARHHQRSKDACGFVCIEHEQGLRVSTREGEEFLRINGIQVQSDAIHCVHDIAHLQQHGADRVRLAPAGDDFFEAVQAFVEWCSGRPASFDTSATVNGYWFGEPGMSVSGTPGA
ncbi:MAG TPA: U32 family peptidase [Gammaproteobacteria bacterium]